jgi:hypothetical protein
MLSKIQQQVANCESIIKNSPHCASEIDLLLGAVARHPDWTAPEVLELHRLLVLRFADELCSLR